MNKLIDTEMISQCWIGTELARALGLNSRYFSRLNTEKPASLNKEIAIQSTAGLVLVRIPEAANKILQSREYIASKITSDDTSEFEYVFNITADVKIGFWK